MARSSARALSTHYRSECDGISEAEWARALAGFRDANIYQTGPYGVVTAGKSNVSRLVLRRNGDLAAMAQARIVRAPLLPAGIAYVRWGPLWKRNEDATIEDFRQALRAVRNEYVCKRGLTLRLLPAIFEDDDPRMRETLAEEGFARSDEGQNSRTILMDLRPSIGELRAGMKAHWKRELRVADKNQLEIVAGTGDHLFESFIHMYREMVSRKKFVEPNDINQFREIQEQLPETMKMTILIGRLNGEACSGTIASLIGDTAIYLFGATSNAGMKSRGSYALQWRLVEELKQRGAIVYDLNGINPEKNPGTYKFKDDLAGVNGRHTSFQGRFEAQGNFVSTLCIQGGEILRSAHRSLKQGMRSVRAMSLGSSLVR